jgi:hypothetical protein
MFNPETIPSELGTDPTRAFKRYAPMLPGRSQTASVHAQAFDDPRRRPRIPSSIQQYQSAIGPGEGSDWGCAAQGGGLIGPVPRSVNVLFRPDFATRHEPG